MVGTSNAAGAASLNDAYSSSFNIAEAGLSNRTHSPSLAPLVFAANDDGDAGSAVASWSLGCGCGCGKRWTDFFRDYVGDGVRPAVTAPTLLTTDLVPGDTSTTATLTVDGDHVISTIDTIGDQDFFAVQLVAGQTYDISLFLVVGGPSLVPLADAYIELYDAAGNLIVTADGGGPNTPSGLDAILTFTAEASGTYYVNARAYDQDPTNGTTGDFVGDYDLSVTTVDTSDPTAYVPFYSPDSPLHSIDWGSQFDRTVRNPDGDNGTRDNGVPDTGTITNPTYGIVGKNVITYYFAEQGDVFLSEDPTNPGLENMIQARDLEQWEMDAFVAAFGLYEQVADLQYVRVSTREEADIKIILYEGTPGVGASLLGRMSPPNEQNEGQMEINAGDYRWTEEGVSPGGFYFPTLLHELGHGHGMAHPHDNGGRSSVMRGAAPSDDPVEGAIGGQFGDFGLSQQIYTIMSYNDGWNEIDGVGGRPAGHGGPSSGGLEMQADHYGWMGTLAALDIALLQDKYGVNEEWATGNDVYVIGDVNQPGAHYSTIWDGGGVDEIRYVGQRDAVIDLRAATLQYEEGGGGRVSFALGAWTGMTIANGVVIERATGGDGDDLITGNGAANILSGGLGADVFIGGGGRDKIYGGDGEDLADYGTAAVAVGVNLKKGKAGIDGNGSTDRLYEIENLTGSAYADRITGDTGVNVILGGAGDDTLKGHDGDDRLGGGAGDDFLIGGVGEDMILLTGLQSEYSIVAGNDGRFAITDLVEGRDGFDQLKTIELVRFGDGTTARLSDMAGMAAAPTVPTKRTETAEVSPLLADDDFVPLKAEPLPTVWPGLQEVEAESGLSGLPATTTGPEFLSLFFHGDPLLPDQDMVGRDAGQQPDWI